MSRYAYDATGIKQTKLVTEGSTTTKTEYAGNFIYENDALKFFNHPEGYIEPNTLIDGTIKYRYFYQYKDHLGNIRLSYFHNETTNEIEIAEENNYYPFGLKHKGYNSIINGTDHKYSYNGKEEQYELGLNWVDYGARNYDNTLGHWMNIDPLADKYYSLSPYNYVNNTPVNAIDPDGMRIYYVAGAGNDKDGWNYVSRTQCAFEECGIQGFKRINSSGWNVGPLPMADMIFSANRRSSSSSSYTTISSRFGPIPISKPKKKFGEMNRYVDSAVEQINEDLKENPLEEGEQFNLAGYSYGSVLQAHVALEVAKNRTIDNLILIGSPISDNSELYKELSSNKNIKKIIRVDIEGDLLSNPKDVEEFLKGIYQNSPAGEGDNAPHFNLARPGADTDQRIKEMAAFLINNGVR